MKIDKDKKLFAAILALSVLAVIMISAHGCTVSSYGDVKLVSLAITPANASVAGNSSQQFTAVGVYTDGTQKPLTGPVSWSSSDSGAATIDPTTGLAQAADVASTQHCTISAALVSDTAIAGSTTLTVKKMNLQSITVTPASATIAIGTAAQFTADGLFSDGTDSLHQDLTSQATWTISDTTVATIAGGLATGVASGGPVTITAASGVIVSNAAALTVSTATLQSITITAPFPKVRVGQTLQMTATGNLSDGVTHQDLTTQVTWASSDPASATVSSSGLVSALLPNQSVIITATLLGQTGTFNLMVNSATGH